jgi:hypothetical protein
MSSVIKAIHEERRRLEELVAKAAAKREALTIDINAHNEAIALLERIERSATDDDSDDAGDDEQLEEPAPATSTRSTVAAKSKEKPAASSSSRRPPPSRREDPDPEPEPERGRVIDIGAGRAPIPDDTNLSRCIDALRARSPHWMTPSGILEVMREQIGHDLPEHINTIINQQMGNQRKLRPYTVPGLQARAVDARRFEYRITGQQKHEPD